MPDYQKMYTCLFNAITDTIAQLDLQNYGCARSLLVLAQQKAEELYLNDEEETA